MQTRTRLKLIDIEALADARPPAIDGSALDDAAQIVREVRTRGDEALRQYSARFDRLADDAPLLLDRTALDGALATLDAESRGVLERTAARIRRFAEAQRASWQPFDIEIEGGRAMQTIVPVDRAGCYAPGGRYPLPSSVLMTTVAARVAGVREIIVASPNPDPMTIAAAAVGGADALLVVGGAPAVGAMAYGTESVRPCDVIVGPGNRWVSAAKFLVSRDVGIDMLAGPSELVIVADASVDPAWVAADLIAQAEHDVAAWPVLITDEASVVDAVNEQLNIHLDALATAEVAVASLQQGCAAVCADRGRIADVCNEIAPEHLQIMTEDASAYAASFRHYGSIFVGARAGEVAGDYGFGPNHVLPTGGSARYAAGLSVFTFLKARTGLQVDGSIPRAWGDVEALARAEGLAGHALAARLRQKSD